MTVKNGETTGDGVLTRRGFLAGASGLVVSGLPAAGVVGCGTTASTAGVPKVPLGSQPSGLPARQHAWVATLATDTHGNPISPQFDRLLFFDVNGTPTPEHARMLEASLRTLERTYPWGPGGLLFTASWGPRYFEHVLGVGSPIPEAKGLSLFELPSIDDYQLCLHFACDDEERLAAVEAALLHGESLPERTASCS